MPKKITFLILSFFINIHSDPLSSRFVSAALPTSSQPTASQTPACTTLQTDSAQSSTSSHITIPAIHEAQVTDREPTEELNTQGTPTGTTTTKESETTKTEETQTAKNTDGEELSKTNPHLPKKMQLTESPQRYAGNNSLETHSIPSATESTPCTSDLTIPAAHETPVVYQKNEGQLSVPLTPPDINTITRETSESSEKETADQIKEQEFIEDTQDEEPLDENPLSEELAKVLPVQYPHPFPMNTIVQQFRVPLACGAGIWFISNPYHPFSEKVLQAARLADFLQSSKFKAFVSLNQLVKKMSDTDNIVLKTIIPLTHYANTSIVGSVGGAVIDLYTTLAAQAEHAPWKQFTPLNISIVRENLKAAFQKLQTAQDSNTLFSPALKELLVRIHTETKGNFNISSIMYQQKTNSTKLIIRFSNKKQPIIAEVPNPNNFLTETPHAPDKMNIVTPAFNIVFFATVGAYSAAFLHALYEQALVRSIQL